MKKNSIIQLFSYSMILLLPLIAGCGDNYAKKDIKYDATSNVKSLNLFVDETYQLKASPSNLQFKWTSSDESVATVSSDGLVTAVGRGTADIIATAGDLSCSVPVVAVVRIPMVDYTLSAQWIELAVGGIQEIKIFPIPTDANDMPDADWTTDDEKVATVTYAGSVKCIALGETKVHCNVGGNVKSLSVKVADILPFPSPHVLTTDPTAPLIIPAKNFDYGGINKAWWWNGKAQNGDGDLTQHYRSDLGDPNCAVNIESGQSPYNNIGWTSSGQWLLYSVDCNEAGNYTFDLSVAVNGNNNGYALQLDGVLVTPDHIPLSSWNGGYQNYRWYHSYPGNSAAPVLNMTVGRHRVKYMFKDGNYNYAAIRFTWKE